MKPIQLRAARDAGMEVPRTLISQNPKAIRAFADEVGRVVAKPVTGTPYAQTYTGLVNHEMLEDDHQLALCPAIYQEYVPGSDHLRLCCFGECTYAALVSSEALDWRQGPFDARPVAVPDETQEALRAILRTLGLRMAIVDMKLTEAGPVWLELNPQGQFLFLEALCDLQLPRRFSEFLLSEARSVETVR